LWNLSAEPHLSERPDSAICRRPSRPRRGVGQPRSPLGPTRRKLPENKLRSWHKGAEPDLHRLMAALAQRGIADWRQSSEIFCQCHALLLDPLNAGCAPSDEARQSAFHAIRCPAIPRPGRMHPPSPCSRPVPSWASWHARRPPTNTTRPHFSSSLHSMAQQMTWSSCSTEARYSCTEPPNATNRLRSRSPTEIRQSAMKADPHRAQSDANLKVGDPDKHC
jgi:hypothetical protein